MDDILQFSLNSMSYCGDPRCQVRHDQAWVPQLSWSGFMTQRLNGTV